MYSQIVSSGSEAWEAKIFASYEKQKKDGFCQDVVDGIGGFIWQNRFGNVLSPHCVNRVIARIVVDYNASEMEAARNEKRDPLIIPRFSVHQLRHTFCTRLCENETDLKLIQEIMGHADISTTMDIYNESNLGRKKNSFARLESISDIFWSYHKFYHRWPWGYAMLCGNIYDIHNCNL